MICCSDRAWEQERSVADLVANLAEEQAAHTICEALGDLPLALSVAGAYLAYVTSMALTEYLIHISSYPLFEQSQTEQVQSIQRRLAQLPQS